MRSTRPRLISAASSLIGKTAAGLKGDARPLNMSKAMARTIMPSTIHKRWALGLPKGDLPPSPFFLPSFPPFGHVLGRF